MEGLYICYLAGKGLFMIGRCIWIPFRRDLLFQIINISWPMLGIIIFTGY